MITELFFCDDCLSGHFSGDFSGLEYYLTHEKAEAREAHIRECLKPYSMALLEVIEEIPFMASDCDCCGEWLAGRRHLIKQYPREEPKNG